MEVLDVLLRLIGAFYVFAGFFATKVTLTADFVDHAIASIEAAERPKVHRSRVYCLLLTSTLVLVGGLMLFVLLSGAQWVFLAGAIWQFAYIGYLAPRYYDLVDAPSPAGRRQTMNAFYIYCVATAIVLLAATLGRLRPLDEHAPFMLSVAAIGVAAYVIYVAQGLKR